MIMVYGDVPSINFWRPFLTSTCGTKPEFDSNEYLKQRLIHFLQQLFPTKFPKYSLVHYGILDWTETDYGAAIHLWKPKYSSEVVGKALTCFGKHRNIHICGETYSDYQGFIEGCIRTTNSAVSELIKSTTAS
jgi:monoamine oxidase